VTEDEGAQLLRTLARAMIELGRVGRTGVISLPYPPLVQHTLDRIASICLDRGESPPGSVPELVAWCTERTPDRWPFPVSADLVRPDSVLVDPYARMPTRTCLELSSGSEGSHEQLARNQLRQLQKAGGAAEWIHRSRGFLIHHPIVLDDSTLQQPERMALWRRVKHLYERVPFAHIVDRRVLTCPTCGLLACAERRRLTWCEAQLCPRDVIPSTHRADAVWLLQEPLRLFLALPGRTEQRVCVELAALGMGITLVDPVEGTYELSRPVHGKRMVHVLDRIEPLLLAAAVTRWPGSLVVVPHRLTDRLEGYAATFAGAMSTATDVTLVSDDELIAFVGGRRKEPGHA
jgi:pPIWI_RE three-gene island domain Y